MKVAYFIGSLNRGGTETLLLDICRKKAFAPYEMIVIYRNEGELSDSYKSTGVPMFRIKPKGLGIGYLLQIRKLLNCENVDLIHAQTLTNAFISLFATLFTKIRLVSTFHGFYWSWFNVLLRQIVMWNADAIVFVSKYALEWYEKHSLCFPKTKCYVVYNGINFEKLEESYSEPDFLKQEGGSKKIRLTMVGNFIGGRSQMIVCKSIKLLIERGERGFIFYFVGKRAEKESHLYDACLDYCEKNGLMKWVRFVGSRGDVPAILQHVDGFVYSTVNDTFGIAVVEAVSVGLPVVVNDWRVMKELFYDKGLVEFFETGNVEDCCDKMQLLINKVDEKKREAFKRAHVVKEAFSIENHIAELNKVYNGLVN